MYHHLLARHHDLLVSIAALLKSENRHPINNNPTTASSTASATQSSSMALDTRYYNAAGPSSRPLHASSHAPPSPMSAGGYYPAATPSVTASYVSTASAATMRSTASSPSLRARESVVVAAGVGVGVGAAGSSRAGTPVNGGGGNVKVVVRVRGFLPREIERGTNCLIRMNPDTQTTTLLAPRNATTRYDSASARAQSRSKVIEDKTFAFDSSFWSHDEDDEHYATQEDVYNCLGEEFLDHNFEGYHTCIFAYGQTGSGKSYTMMGTPENPGLIPRTCEDLFQRIESSESPNISYTVRVSYFEVYNEHVRDLLVPRTETPYYLKIRESPTDGPYVKDLTDVPVRSFAELMKYMRKGDASRTTASTKMNDTSSRSHAVFTIMLKQIHHDLSTDETTERTARIRLVDLAGSERAKSTEATGQRLREGSNINKSLTTLGRVIAALADNKPGRRKNKDIVPYRDSILTWLLKDSLGGNSKTAMIACVAPSDYDETLSTLRYADQAKRIRTRAIVNQDHVSAAERDAQIAEMAEIIRTLQLSVSQQNASKRESEMQNEKLEEYQKQVAKMQQLMEETKMVSECKIRQLQTENEALRLHLKLALESLKNPIPSVEVMKQRRKSRNPSLASVLETETETGSVIVAEDDDEVEAGEREEKEVQREQKVRDRDGEKGVEGDDEKENDAPAEESEPDLIWDEEDTPTSFTSEASEAEAMEMQACMEELLQDLNFFRRKVADDHRRFGIQKKQMPVENQHREVRVLSEVCLN
ncbi:hypothetical protein AJ80_00701 [Polytolypa hystricis UAMH7299]|uniref:Kinesin-like protein n=1 Tax=Polytolypa hystricis (strain UAMH7299) TaxID=1447883 RepID=A0A2B7Z181_POLH7|nr:hypothetical protein AJ80_00701 [Polytolypa hystricis UAMH7299]